MKWDVFIKDLCKLKLDGFVRKSPCAIGLWTELVAFFMEQLFFVYLNYDYSGLGIWWTFSQKEVRLSLQGR